MAARVVDRRHHIRCPLARPWMYDPDEDVDCICSDLEVDDAVEDFSDE